MRTRYKQRQARIEFKYVYKLKNLYQNEIFVPAGACRFETFVPAEDARGEFKYVYTLKYLYQQVCVEIEILVPAGVCRPLFCGRATGLY